MDAGSPGACLAPAGRAWSSTHTRRTTGGPEAIRRSRSRSPVAGTSGSGRSARERQAIAFVYGNCVFAGGLDDVWAAFVVEPSSYAWLDQASKRARFVALVGAIEALEADLQILRVSARPAPGQFRA